MDSIVWPIVWTVSGVVIAVTGVLAARSRTARYVGRAAGAFLFVVGGALVHVINLVTGVDYAGFADPALFAWVTDDWRAIVAPHPYLFIGLLAAFEATAGVLTISGGRRTQVGLAAVIGFY